MRIQAVVLEFRHCAFDSVQKSLVVVVSVGSLFFFLNSKRSNRLK